jgi:hypothetical protein
MNQRACLSYLSLFVTLLASTEASAQSQPFNCNSGQPCLSIVQTGPSAEALQATTLVGNGIAAAGTANGFQGVGVEGSSIGASGTGVEGISASGNGVMGEAQAAGTSGVYGFNIASSGYGVAGRMTASGNTGIAVYGDNANAGGYAGYFNGNVHVTGTFSQNSDLRLKKNVKPLESSLNQVLRLRGVNYEWRDASRGAGTQSGFIAQDVEKVFPQWVGLDPDGYKTLNTRGLEALTVESIRALELENEALAERIRTLETERSLSTSGFTGERGLTFGGFLLLAGAVVATRRKRGDGGLAAR